MRFQKTLAILLCPVMFCFASSVYAGDDGMITKKSNYSVKETLDRLENILKKKGIAGAIVTMTIKLGFLCVRQSCLFSATQNSEQTFLPASKHRALICL